MRMQFQWPLMRSFLAEFLSTTFFAFSVYSFIISVSITENFLTAPAVLVIGIGFAGTAVIYAFCGWAPAHFNPAITAGALASGRMPFFRGLGYILMQFLGALFAMGLIYCAFPNVQVAGQSLSQLVTFKKNPNANIFQAMAMEAVLAFILVFVAMATAIGVQLREASVKLFLPKTMHDVEQNSNMRVHTDLGSNRTGFFGVAIGLTLGFLGTLSSASSAGPYNPALALAPTLISGYWTDIYIYLVGEFVGGIFAGLYYRFIFQESLKRVRRAQAAANPAVHPAANAAVVQ